MTSANDLALLSNERARNYNRSMGEWGNREDTPLVLDESWPRGVRGDD